jgi:mRNA interferase MazF
MGRQRRRETLGQRTQRRPVNDDSRLIRRGEIWLIEFDPARPNEANSTRPVIIITNNTANARGTLVTAIPVTTNIERVYPFQVLLPNNRTDLNEDSKAQLEQVRSVSKSRLLKRIGQVPEDLMLEIGTKLRMHLEL